MKRRGFARKKKRVYKGWGYVLSRSAELRQLDSAGEEAHAKFLFPILTNWKSELRDWVPEEATEPTQRITMVRIRLYRAPISPSRHQPSTPKPINRERLERGKEFPEGQS